MQTRIRLALLLVGTLVAASCSRGAAVEKTIHNSDRRISVVSVNTLPAGAKAPFSIPYTGGTHDVAKVSATVKAEPSVQMQYTTVQVATKTGKALGTAYEVTGTVSNSS